LSCRVNITLECFKFEKGFHGREANAAGAARGVALTIPTHESAGI